MPFSWLPNSSFGESKLADWSGEPISNVLCPVLQMHFQKLSCGFLGVSKKNCTEESVYGGDLRKGSAHSKYDFQPLATAPFAAERSVSDTMVPTARYLTSSNVKSSACRAPRAKFSTDSRTAF
jgi:hypothetical protein